MCWSRRRLSNLPSWIQRTLSPCMPGKFKPSLKWWDCLSEHQLACAFIDALFCVFTYILKPIYLATDPYLWTVLFETQTRPTWLSCALPPSPQHMFCDECISLWLNREKTCPLCRTVIADSVHKWKDGATSMHLQIY